MAGVESDVDKSEYIETSGEIETESDGSEFWDETSSDILDEDILSAPPISEPAPKQRKLNMVHSLLQWFLYCLLIWQSITHLSDNGLIWLLQMIFYFLEAINVHIPNEVFAELVAVFPCFLYMARKYLSVDRDNFTKYVVCPKCTKCYHYNECLKKVHGRTVAKLCSSLSFARRKSVRCNAKLVKKVVLKDNQIKFYPIMYYCYNGVINPLEEILKRKGVPESCEKW